jgi:hypothetical protein
VLQDQDAFHSAGHAELACSKCRDGWTKPVSKEALSVGLRVLSGTLDRFLGEKPVAGPSKEILSYALDILERHMEKHLASRKMLEAGEIAPIES